MLTTIMLYKYKPFGNEIRFLNTTISTATNTRFNLKGKSLTKKILQFTGLPHFGARLRAFYLKQLLKSLDAPQNILDTGCGIGLNSFLAAQKGFKVTGVDNNKEKIIIAERMLSSAKYPNVRFVYGDITKMEFKDESFTSIICFEVLEHIDNDKKALNEISRVLKRNGILLLSTPGISFISRINQKTKHHVREGYSLQEISEKLHDVGLEITKLIKIEHTPLGFLLRFLNDEIHRRSLLTTTLLFPLFFPLAIIDGFLPEIITPSNWIVVAKKK